jgi:hypothetical protein
MRDLGVEEIKDMFWDKISPIYDIFEKILDVTIDITSK